MRTRSFALLSLLLAAAASPSAFAEEGMYLYNDFPSAAVQKAYGFSPSPEFLEHLRLSSVRLANGCSASFVSPQGLVMTNHHCARSCVEELSTAKSDYLEHGFYAPTAAAERRCPKFEVNQLVAITDVTPRVLGATQGLSGAKYAAALKQIQATIEGECGKGDQVRCDVVTLFHGGAFHLYRYRRFQDVRLVFAPEFPMAAFGGDPDNFNFPRYGFDNAFLRVYDQGKPLATNDFFRWASKPVKQGDLVFVSGHPGGTERKSTVAELELQRDVVLPHQLLYLSQLRGVMAEYMRGSADRFRTTRARIRSVENARKALKGRREFLADPKLFQTKVDEERALRDAIAKDPAKQAKYADAWDQIAAATTALRTSYVRYHLSEGLGAFDSDLFPVALKLVRAAAELGKPNGERLHEYSDAQRPALEQSLFGVVPVRRDLEQTTLTFSLSYLQSELGADDPFVKTVLGRDSTDVLARKLATGTKLDQLAVRKALFAGGQKAIDASTDPMIVLARRIDPELRRLRKHFEDDIESVLTRNGERIAQAYVAVHGTSGYPDATFTLRLSYGQVQGWRDPSSGAEIPAMTTFGGLFERDTGQYPFAVSPKWKAAKRALDLSTPMDVATTNDIIGGNSGSPLIDRDGRICGLIFDGNLPSLGGRYGYDPATNRAVGVHGAGLRSALEQVYRADRVVKELVVE